MSDAALLSRRVRRRVKALRWKATRLVGSERYTWAALNDLDRQLVEITGGARDGTFVELGGNDGLQQSNTLALETLFGWRGLLIEADPELAAECLRNRPDAMVICAAAGADRGFASLVRDDLVGTVVPGGETAAPSSSPTVVVPTAPLSDLIDAGLGDRPVDLLSIDVEGAELDVLAGLDLRRHRPERILVETDQPDAVAAALGGAYEPVGVLSFHDHLFARAGSGTRDR